MEDATDVVSTEKVVVTDATAVCGGPTADTVGALRTALMLNCWGAGAGAAAAMRARAAARMMLVLILV